MKIIILTSEFPPGPGGIGDHAFNLSVALVKNGHSVHVVSELRTQFLNRQGEQKFAAQIHYVKRTKLLPNLGFVFVYLKLVLVHRKSIVIATGSKSVLLAGLINVFWKSKLIAILHGHEVLMGNRVKRWLLRKVLPSFNHAVSVSEFSKENSRKYLDANKITVIPNGIDPEKFKIQTKEFVLDRNAFHLLTVGRVSARKGQLNVIKALPAILEKYPETQYHIVGINSDAEATMSWVKKLGVEKHIKFYGVVSDEQLMMFYKATDAFVMLSENMPDGDVEGFGIAILEANYFGKPAIGSAGCGIEQAIRQRYNGLLVDPHRPNDIVDAVGRIKSDYLKYSNNSKEWASQHHWSAIVESYEKILSTIA